MATHPPDGCGCLLSTHVENGHCVPLARFSVLLCQRYHMLGQTLCLLCLVPCRVYLLLLDERCDKVAKEGLTVC